MNRRMIWTAAALLLVGLAYFSTAQENTDQTAPAEQATTAEDPVLQNFKQKLSYYMGFRTAQQMQSQIQHLDLAAFRLGMDDVQSNGKMRLEEAQLIAASKDMQAHMKKLAEEGQAAADKLLAENGKREGVTTTESGLQYQVIKAGDGASPKPTDVVKVHYEGKLADGTVFDSSYERGEPTQFPVNRVIPGWTEALALMKVGGKWKLMIPPNLAYREMGAGALIGPNAALIFTVELLEIEKAE